jgi:hypothetical protein
MARLIISYNSVASPVMSARASTPSAATGCLEDGRPHSGDQPGRRSAWEGLSAVDRYLLRITTRSGTQRARAILTPTVAVLDCAQPRRHVFSDLRLPENVGGRRQNQP